MNNELQRLLPKWVHGNEKHDLVLSNDIDSLASCAVLKKVKGWEIKYFYDFNKIYKTTEKRENKYVKCWVDVAIKKGHAFDNHVSRIDLFDDWNDDMVNLNNCYWISNEDYCNKYAGSTLLEVWSIYNLPLPQTEKGKMILLAIDVAFKGFYSDKFHDTQKRYLCEDLGFYELYDVIKRHNKDEFYDLIAEYGLNADIKCNGNLETKLKLEEIGKLLGLELDLPTDRFKAIHELEIVDKKITPQHKYLTDIDKSMVTAALTYKDKIRYSRIEQGE